MFISKFKFLLMMFVFVFSTGEGKNNNEASDFHFASIELLAEQRVGALVLPKIYQNLGYQIKVTPFPGVRAQQLANSGKADGEIMRIWTYGDETPNVIRVPTPYYQLETMPFFLKSSHVKINSKADLAKYRVAKVRGVKHTANITQGLRKAYNVKNTEKGFKLLLDGKVDVMLTNTIDGKNALAALGVTNINANEKPLAVLPLFHYIHKKHQALVDKVDKEIIRLKASGELTHHIALAEQQVIDF